MLLFSLFLCSRANTGMSKGLSWMSLGYVASKYIEMHLLKFCAVSMASDLNHLLSSRNAEM